MHSQKRKKNFMLNVKTNTFGAVVVLYNPTDDEIRNINSYKNKVDCTVIVDNSDVDHRQLVNKIVSLTNSIIYYSEHKNLGLAKGFDIGVDLLIKNNCEWALLFDADSKMSTDLLAVYKNAINEHGGERVSVFSPVHVFDRSNNISYKGYRDIDWAMTSGCLYNCELFVKQKGFFEKLFVDGIDMDYCFKSHENGYKVIECGEAVLNHNPGETRSFLGLKYGVASPFRYYMQARQLIWCWKKYGKNKLFFTYLYKWFKVIFLFPDKKEYIKEMIKGTKEGNKLLQEYGV